MLKLDMDRKLVLLGKIHEARALRALVCPQKCQPSRECPCASAEGLKDLSLKDSEIAAKAIRDVMEYMITHLQGITAHMKRRQLLGMAGPTSPCR